jgi:cell division transport system permease protein
MNIGSLLFLIQEAFLNIRRNGLMSLAALGTVTVALTVLGASLWTAYRINEIAQDEPKTFNEVDVFLSRQATRPQTDDVLERVKKLPNVGKVHLVTKEVAWAEMQSREPKLTAAMDTNPLPDKLEVEAIDPSKMDHLVHQLRVKTDFPEVADVTAASQEVKMLLGFARLVKAVGVTAAVGLFIATLFIVHNTIRLTVFARRREIKIMQLVGATPGFIRFPLLLEGVFHGVVGAMIAGGIVLYGGHEVAHFVHELNTPLVGDIPSRLGPIELVSGLMAIGALVGLVGSHFAMRRFLKQV